MGLYSNFPYSDFENINLDWIINKVKEYLAKVDTLEIDFNALKEYVVSYFDNLDIQEEVNNKLDEMASSGQLAEIISQYLDTLTLIAFNTKEDMKSATNLVDGVDVLTLGTDNYKDGLTHLYKVRTITSEDIVDDINIIALSNYPTLIAELLPYYLDNEIIALNNKIESMSQHRVGIHRRYYVDNVNGDDNNDGKTEATAFKTLNKFFELSNTNTDIRCYLVSAGVYEVADLNTFSSIAVHITPLVAGCTVKIISDNAIPFYNTYWHLEGLDNANKLIFEAVDGVGNYLPIGGENNTFFTRNCIINSELVFSCSNVVLNNSQIMKVNLNTCMFIFAVIAILNTDPNLSPLTFANCKGRLTGSLSGTQELTNTSDNNAFIVCENTNLYLGWNCPSLNNKYYNFIKSTLGTIINTSESIWNTKSRAVNGSDFDYTYGAVITNNGIRNANSVRYSSGSYQYFNATTDTWTNI